MGEFSVGKFTFFLGLAFLLIAYIIPHKSLEFALGALRPLGFVGLYLNPALGIVGAIFSLFKREWLFLLLNIILVFTYFIIISLGYGMY